MSPATTAIVGPGGNYQTDREVSDVDDPDLGAAALEDDAIGGGGVVGGSEDGGGLETWPDDDDEEDEPRHARGTGKADAGPSVESAARGGTRKRKQGVVLFGSAPKKTKNPTAATRRKEAAAKAAKFQKLPKAPPMVSAAPLSLEKPAAASVIGSAETSTTTQRIDPTADLREAQERNMREAREEQEAARREKAEADKAEAAALKKLAEAEADFAAKKLAEEAARRQAPLFVIPLNSVPPPPEFTAPTGGAGDEQPVMEREGGDVVMPEADVPPPPLSQGAQENRQAGPLVQPAGGEMATGPTPEAHTPSRRRGAKTTSVPRSLEAGAASLSVPDAEETSAAPTEWVRGGGTGALNRAVLDVQAKLRAEAIALQQCNRAFMDSRAAIRDYHNLRATTFNSNVRELDQRTADLSKSRKANAVLQQQLGEANTALRAKEIERSELAQEHDRLAKQLAEQAELLQKARKEAEVKESNLLAEFKTERSAWADKEALLTAGFGRIEDMVDDFFPGHSSAANQAIEAYHEERRAEGAADRCRRPRTLSEQLLSIQAIFGRLIGCCAEAQEELVAVERDLVRRAAAIAEYTNTSIFVLELAENGAEAPPEWFGLNPEDDEDSAEMIDSSDEGEDEEDEEGEEDMPEVGADGQP
nr:uncharacterized protein LOC109745887 [Aegilops tauschii subsp. strangulata]